MLLLRGQCTYSCSFPSACLSTDRWLLIFRKCHKIIFLAYVKTRYFIFFKFVTSIYCHVNFLIGVHIFFLINVQNIYEVFHISM